MSMRQIFIGICTC